MCNKINRQLKYGKVKTGKGETRPMTDEEQRFLTVLSSRLGGKKSKNKPIGKPISGRRSRRLLG